jgi:hypothetical protein
VGQPEAGGGILLEVTEPVLLADGRGMTPALPAVAISIQTGRRGLAELTRDGRDHCWRRLRRIVQKGAQEARRPQLNRKAETVVRAAHRAHQLAVSRVEMEVARELLFVGVADVSAVPGQLLIGQETAWHGVRNFGLLRQSGRGPKIRHLHPAKIPCGIAALCDKFRTPAGRRA